MILIIDNYDSFTYNLVDYVGKLGKKNLQVERNDKITLKTIETLKPTSIIISPGPKTPSEAGITKALIKQFFSRIPLLGVCLGHQAICEHFGGRTIPAKHLMHGKTSLIDYNPCPLFKNLPNPFVATRYHSLSTDKKALTQTPLKIVATSTDDQEIMAVEHPHYPVYGVQFHPESILTEVGITLIENFLHLSKN